MSKPFVTLVNKVLELAEENPNNVYQEGEDNTNCSYVAGECSNGSTGCIIGQALIICGYADIQTLKEFEDSSEYGNGLLELFEHLDFFCPTLVSRWLSEAQLLQDGGGSWSQAIDNANSTVGDIDAILEDYL